MTRLLTALALLLSLGPVAATAEDAPTYDSLWKLANSAPGHQTKDGGLAIVVDVPSERAIYNFTKPGEPIHPGVIKRTVVQDGDAISLQTQGWSFAPDNAQEPFKKWLAAFQAQAAEIQAQIRNQSGSPTSKP